MLLESTFSTVAAFPLPPSPPQSTQATATFTLFICLFPLHQGYSVKKEGQTERRNEFKFIADTPTPCEGEGLGLCCVVLGR